MEEILTNESGTEMSNDGVDYISAINEIKQNSVDKKQYLKLQQENKRLLDALVDGKQIDMPKVEEPNIPEMRKKLFGEDLNNLEYVDTALKLRTALMEKGTIALSDVRNADWYDENGIWCHK